jgi:hypothetical protein
LSNPLDPFTSRPLIYERRGKGYLLSSVSVDRKPDKSIGAERADDIVLRVE